MKAPPVLAAPPCASLFCAALLCAALLYGAPATAAAGAALSGATAKGASSAAASTARVEVMFVGPAEGPHALVVVEEARKGDAIARTARAVVVGAAGAVAAEEADVVRGTLSGLTGLVAAPAGASLRWTDDHGVVVGFDRGLAWNAVVPPPAEPAAGAKGQGKAPPPPPKIPVPTPGALRLVVDPPWPSAGEARAAPASLHGAHGAVAGTALVRQGPPAGAAALLVDEKGAVEKVEAGAPGLFVVDVQAACGKSVPTTFSVGEGAALLRVEPAGAPACATGGAAVVPVVGARGTGKAAQRFRGLIVVP